MKPVQQMQPTFMIVGYTPDEAQGSPSSSPVTFWIREPSPAECQAYRNRMASKPAQDDVCTRVLMAHVMRIENYADTDGAPIETASDFIDRGERAFVEKTCAFVETVLRGEAEQQGA